MSNLIVTTILSISLSFVCLFHPLDAHSSHPIFVVIAFDGFRYDYLDRGFTPILKDLAQNGSSAQYMINQFPTKTFPNFHSISTGMLPETHGVLGNLVFENGTCITYSYKLFHYNEDIVPLWMLNEDSGAQRYSGVMMWPGSDFKYQQKLPTFVEILNNSIGWRKRIDKVISWLIHPSTPTNLVFSYFEQPDEAGHEAGPDSAQVNNQLQNINLIMKYYLKRLTIIGIRDLVNTIVLSDHGMAAIDINSILNLDDYIDPNSYSICATSPGLQIQPKSDLENEIYKNLTSASTKIKKFSVYKREDVPERWRIKNNPRFARIFVESKIPYVFQDAKTLRGDHGYDYLEPKMHPIFLAQGPQIKKNFSIQPFENIDIYPFIAHTLKLKAPPTHVTPNGTLDSLKNILKDN